MTNTPSLESYDRHNPSHVERLEGLIQQLIVAHLNVMPFFVESENFDIDGMVQSTSSILESEPDKDGRVTTTLVIACSLVAGNEDGKVPQIPTISREIAGVDKDGGLWLSVPGSGVIYPSGKELQFRELAAKFMSLVRGSKTESEIRLLHTERLTR